MPVKVEMQTEIAVRWPEKASGDGFRPIISPASCVVLEGFLNLSGPQVAQENIPVLQSC